MSQSTKLAEPVCGNTDGSLTAGGEGGGLVFLGRSELQREVVQFLVKFASNNSLGSDRHSWLSKLATPCIPSSLYSQHAFP